MRTYFTKLVAAFLLTSLVPILITGISFYLAGRSLVLRNAESRARESINRSVEHIDNTIETYRHIAYVISKDPTIVRAVSGIETWNSERLKKLYKQMYEPLEGHIYSAAAHVVSRDGSHFFSTHTLPKHYDLRVYENHEGIFSEKRNDPEKSYIYIDPFVTVRGDRVALTILREIPNGYVIVDVYDTQLVSAESHPFFDSLLIADRNQLQAFDFYHPERDGTFDQYEELELLGASLFKEECVKKDTLLAISAQIPGTQLYTVGGVHLEGYIQNISAIGIYGAWFLLIIVIFILFIAFKLSRSISGPVHSVVGAMQKTEQGTLTQAPELQRRDELGYLVHTYNSMVVQLEELIEQVRQEERALQVAERKALQAQINPHFLYNTLGTIKSMAKLQKSTDISDVVTRLGKLLHTTFSQEGAFYSIGRSIEIVHDYISIQKHRFGDRLQVTYNVHPHVRSCKIPRLLLQPIVENAVIHGVEKTSTPVRINISAHIIDEYVELQVCDTGPGSPSETNGNGIGIANIRRRIVLAYGDQGSFNIESEPNKGTCVTIHIPYELYDEKSSYNV